MLPKMIAMDYNILLSIISLIDSTIKSPLINDYISGVNIDVLPAYPRNLTKFTKPSIIVQRVSTDNMPICFGNFVGQYHDDISNTDTDVFGINYESTYQIDVCGDSNTQRSLMTSFLLDEVFGRAKVENNNQINIYDFTSSIDEPKFIGYAKIDYYIDVENLDKTRLGNEYKVYNYDYVDAIRFDISMIRIVTPKQNLVDLTKPIKFTQRVKL